MVWEKSWFSIQYRVGVGCFGAADNAKMRVRSSYICSGASNC